MTHSTHFTFILVRAALALALATGVCAKNIMTMKRQSPIRRAALLLAIMLTATTGWAAEVLRGGTESAPVAITTTAEIITTKYGTSVGYFVVNENTTITHQVRVGYSNNSNIYISIPTGKTLTVEDVLTKLTVTALDANDNTIKERIFENVPVVRNQVTRYTGSFFGNGGGGSTGSGDFRMTADPEWDSVNGYTF